MLISRETRQDELFDLVVQQQSLEKQRFSITHKKTFREINCLVICLVITKRYFHEIFGKKVLWRVNFYTENSEVDYT